MRVIFTIFGLFIASLGLLPACSMLSDAPQGPASWPTAGAGARVNESDYIDLKLRVAALELTQHSNPPFIYYFVFLPQAGKVEATCLSQKPLFSFNDRPSWTTALERQTALIASAASEAFSGTAMGHGFDPKRHLEIHFQIEESSVRELAVYQAGTLQWLVPSP